MAPRLNARLVCLLFSLGAMTTAVAQLAPQGLLLYQEPATTFTEAIEYRSFQRDNPLYASLVTFKGEKKQLKAAGVVAVVLYPPVTFDSDFAGTAQRALTKIDALEQSHPTARQALQQARAKWVRASSVYKQTQTKPAATTAPRPPPAALSLGNAVLQNARMTGATSKTVTVTHASGVITLPLAPLKTAEVLALNRTSDTLQLPLGFARPGSAAPATSVEAPGGLTARIGATGREVVSFCAEKWGVSETVFSTWAFFVVLPGLVLLFLLAWIDSARRSKRVAKLPRAR